MGRRKIGFVCLMASMLAFVASITASTQFKGDNYVVPPGEILLGVSLHPLHLGPQGNATVDILPFSYYQPAGDTTILSSGSGFCLSL